jgi:hypothetical protein
VHTRWLKKQSANACAIRMWPRSSLIRREVIWVIHCLKKDGRKEKRTAPSPRSVKSDHAVIWTPEQSTAHLGKMPFSLAASLQHTE